MSRIEATRDRIVSTALDWLGVPFLHRGRDRTGVDCAGLVLVARNAALSPSVEETDYPRIMAKPRIREMLCLHAKEIMLRELERGDVVIMSQGGETLRKGWNHLGVWTGSGVVNATYSRGVIYEAAPIAFPRVCNVYRWKGLE